MKIFATILAVLVIAVLLPMMSISIGNMYTLSHDWTTQELMNQLTGEGYLAYSDIDGNWTVTGDATVEGDTTLEGELTAPTGRTATYVIAASDAPAHVKAQADYVCDGTADNVEIQAALDMGNSDNVYLSTGTFHIAATIIINTGGRNYLMGSGIDSTVLLRDVGVTDPIIKKNAAAVYIAGFNLSEMNLDGNGTAGHVIDGTAIHGGIYRNLRLCNAPGKAGFYVSAATEYCTFENILFGDGVNLTNYGVKLTGASNFRFYNCNSATLTNNGSSYQMIGCSSIYFYNCTADEANMPGGSVAWSGFNITGTSTRIYLTNCEAYGETTNKRLQAGIYIQSTDVTDVYIDGFTCANTSGGSDALAILNTTGLIKGIHFNNCVSQVNTNFVLFVGDANAAHGFNNITFTNNDKKTTTPTMFAYFNPPMLLQNIKTDMNVNYIGSGEVRTASGSLTPTGVATATTVTGTFTESPLALKPGANIMHCTVNGTANIVMPAGSTAVVTSIGGGATVTGDPKTCPASATTLITVTAGGTNDFTITVHSNAFAWHDPELQDIFITKIVINRTAAGGTATAEMNVGIADNGTVATPGTEFFNNMLVNNAAAIHDSYVAGGTSYGTQTIWVNCQDFASATGGWVVGKLDTEIANSLAGTWYIEYTGK